MWCRNGQPLDLFSYPFQGNGYIQLQFSGADTEKALVKGRIKFMESEDWTKEGRSREARDTPQEFKPEDSVRLSEKLHGVFELWLS